MLYHGNAMDYIYETPDILQYILEHKKEILEDSSRVLKDKYVQFSGVITFTVKSLSSRSFLTCLQSEYSIQLKKKCGVPGHN